MSVYPVTAGHPDYSSTGANAYIPAIYSALVVKKFYPETVFSKISQTDYEGDIKSQGDTVNIRTRATIETFKYKKGMVLPVQNPESPYIQLKVDQGEGFNFAIDRIDEIQADIKIIDIFAEDAAKQMAQVIDLNVLTSIAVAGAVAGGKAASTINGYANVNSGFQTNYTKAGGALVGGGTTAKGTTITAGTAVGNLALSDAAYSANTGNEITNKILTFARFLNENNAPKDGRFVIIPMWAEQILLGMENNNFGLAYATGQNTAGIITGTIPKIAGFDVISSNNLPTSTQGTDACPIIFGCKYGTTFASQITENRMIDNPYAFGKLMQGVQVYGFAPVKQQLLGVDFWINS